MGEGINQDTQKDFYMIYIGFSTKTHKLCAYMFCHHFKHCAPIVITKNKCELYQFTKPHQITIITLTKRDLKILESHGWKFIKYSAKKAPQNASDIYALTCVQFTKRFCGIKKITIQTPDVFLKYLQNK